MRNKRDRLLAIRNLINEFSISSQEVLLKLLVKRGFRLTQATLSRDLRLLKVLKVPGQNNTYVYAIQDVGNQVTPELKSGFPLNGFLSIQFAQGLGLIKTLPGFASGIASAIDTMNFRELAGTVAGDDTIILIPRDGTNREDIISRLSSLIPGMKNNIV
jgi:transcriptional regulator of arginine metabolism